MHQYRGEKYVRVTTIQKITETPHRLSDNVVYLFKDKKAHSKKDFSSKAEVVAINKAKTEAPVETNMETKEDKAKTKEASPVKAKTKTATPKLKNSDTISLPDTNPHRQGTNDFAKYKKLKQGMTVAEAYDAGIGKGYLHYMVKRGLFKIK